MQTKQNQAITMHPLFFEPIYKRACFEQKEGFLFLIRMISGESA